MPQRTSQFEIVPNQPKILEMERSPLDGVFTQLQDGENRRENDFNRFTQFFSQPTHLLNLVEKEIPKIKREHSLFQGRIEKLIVGLTKKITFFHEEIENLSDEITKVSARMEDIKTDKKIIPLKIPKSQNKEIEELSQKITELSSEVKKKTIEKEGVAGGVGSTIVVHRNLGKLFRKETPRGTIDGSNKTFLLSRSPFAGFLILELNGIGQTKDEDYTIEKNKITYIADVPSGSTHYAIFF